MKPQNSPDPLDELGRANPVHPDQTPSESKARVWARVQEVTMEDNRVTRPRRTGWVLGLAGAAVAGLAVAALALNNGGAPTLTDEPGTGIGSCVETYSAEALGNRDFAFDGSVTAIDGDQVTFAVNERYVGDIGNEVTLTATGMTGTSISSAGGPNLAIDGRYLVAGDETFVWACGFTQPYDEAVAAEWANATR